MTNKEIFDEMRKHAEQSIHGIVTTTLFHLSPRLNIDTGKYSLHPLDLLPGEIVNGLEYIGSSEDGQGQAWFRLVKE
jgi:hypothetical protein